MVKLKRQKSSPTLFRGTNGYSCKNEMLWDLCRSSIGVEIYDVNVFIDGIRNLGYTDLGHFPLLGTIKPQFPQFQFCSITYHSFTINCYVYEPENRCFMTMISHPNAVTMNRFWKFCLGKDIPKDELGNIRFDDVLNRQYEHITCQKARFPFLGKSFAIYFWDKSQEFQRTNIKQEFFKLVG